MNKRNATIAGLTLGALGVVFGDIGTSPLYALQAIFGSTGQHLAINQLNVHGIISLVIWSVTLVVSIKYVSFIMRADNKGEGGIMALVAQVKSSTLISKYKWLFVSLGLIGVALFYGDSVITPAISVLSAVEGVKLIAPSFASLVLPITLIVLLLLFWVQRYGTAFIGRLFGPVMLGWFTVIGVAGAWQIWLHPGILAALSPLVAIDFFITQPALAFVAMGAVVLAITGAEALYADMGHFGRPPIRKAWFFVVFPSLMLCYMGQGALLLHINGAVDGAFFMLFPSSLHIPIILLAMTATFIASQSVISGAFSLTRQAIQLNFLPKLRIHYTSDKTAGQIYIPFVNFLLFIAVMSLVIFFGSSEKLANAFGVAVSGTLAVDTVLFLVVARTIWKKSLGVVVFGAIVFLSVDLLFIASNMVKISHGGWIPIAIAAGILVVVYTWRQGQDIIKKKQRGREGKLETFIADLRERKPSVTRIPGQVVYIGHHAGYTPLALRVSVEELHELHEKVVIVYVETSTLAHVPAEDRAVFDSLGTSDDGISELRLLYGFHDLPNIPRDLEQLRHLSPELDFDSNETSYFVSLTKVVPGKHRNHFARWRKSLYCLLANSALARSDYYRLPIDKTVEVQTLIEV
jgi:KUP system potassium uptake protein